MMLYALASAPFTTCNKPERHGKPEHNEHSFETEGFSKSCSLSISNLAAEVVVSHCWRLVPGSCSHLCMMCSGFKLKQPSMSLCPQDFLFSVWIFKPFVKNILTAMVEALIASTLALFKKTPKAGSPSNFCWLLFLALLCEGGNEGDRSTAGFVPQCFEFVSRVIRITTAWEVLVAKSH